MSITVWDPDAGETLTSMIAAASSDLDSARAVLKNLHYPPRSATSPLPYDPVSVSYALDQIHQASEVVEVVANDLFWYQCNTACAGFWYDFGESAVQQGTQMLAGTLAYGAGIMLQPLMSAAMVAGAGLLMLQQANPQLYDTIMAVAGNVLGSAGSGGLLDQLLESPAAAPIIELMVDSTDEFLAGATRVDPWILRVLQQRPDAENQASVVALLALAAQTVRNAGSIVTGRGLAAPLFGGTPVATPVQSTGAPVAAADSTADAMAVIEHSDSDIVIQEFTRADGSTHWQVYVQGTEDWALASDVSGLSLGGASHNILDGKGSTAAVLAAMQAAGVQPGDSVDLFGFSQGGQAAAQVAANGDFNVEHVVTYGAPVGATVIDEDVEHIAIETSQDIVPALGGTYDESNATVVTVDISDEELEAVPGEHVGANAEHNGQVYIAAAAQVDDAGDPIIDSFNDDLSGSLEGAEAGETFEFEIEAP